MTDPALFVGQEPVCAVERVKGRKAAGRKNRQTTGFKEKADCRVKGRKTVGVKSRQTAEVKGRQITRG